MLVCSHCSSAVAITLTSELSVDSYNKLCRAYRKRIMVSCHETNCNFRLSAEQFKLIEYLGDDETYGSDAFDSNVDGNDEDDNVAERDLIKIPTYFRTVLDQGPLTMMEHPHPSNVVRTNANQLTEVTLSLSGNSLSPKSWKYPKLDIPQCLQDVFNTSRGTYLKQLFRLGDASILSLSIMGWQKVDVYQSNDLESPVVIMGCPLCFSTKKLLLEPEHFTVDTPSNKRNCSKMNNLVDDRIKDQQSPSKRRKIVTPECRFDVLDGHRHYCPFQVGFPNKVTDRYAVWKVILERLIEESIRFCERSEHEDAWTMVQGSTTTLSDHPTKTASFFDDAFVKVRKVLRAGIADGTVHSGEGNNIYSHF